MKHLALDLWGLTDAGGPYKHAQTVMKELGITYQYAVPQSIADMWQFFNCENIPEKLPSYITELKIDDPMELIGYGLSKEMAENIIKKSKSKL